MTFITPEFKSFYEGYMRVSKDTYKKFKTENTYGYVFDIYDANKDCLENIKLETLTVSERMCILLVIINEADISKKNVKEFLQPFKPELVGLFWWI